MIRRLLRRALPPWSSRGIAFRRLVGIPVLADPITVWPYYASRHPDVMFVQIGSHNGVDGDPLRTWITKNPRWRGIFVEPVPEQFAALSRLRGKDPRFRLVRAAITDHDGSVVMTVVDGPSQSGMLSSINADVVYKNGVRAEETQQVSVPAMTFATLTTGAPPIDVLHIDTEGHDAVILDQVDLRRVRPAVIMFESVHLSAVDRRRCEGRLIDAGYRVVSNSFDTLAILEH